jgi:ribosomal protein S18 acetylase RimI-like enzyme
VRTDPGLRNYWDDFGRKDDYAYIALVGGQVVGIAWARILGGDTPGYGHVDDQTPELAIAVVPGLRGQGIGTKLMEELLAFLAEAGYAQASLSVQKDNPAARLYRRLGFETVAENQTDYIMVKLLP